jgi:hypothetical protein
MRELQLFLDDGRAAALAQFPSAGRTDADFWSSKVDGQTPAGYLVGGALAGAARVLVQFQLAAKHGISAPSNYADFLRLLDEENQRRLTAVEKNEPIYGPKQYSETNYLGYLVDGVAVSLQGPLVNDGTLVVNDAAIDSYFVQHPQQFQLSDGTVADIHDEKVRSKIATAVTQTEYDAYVDQLAQQAVIQRSPSLDTVLSGGCLASGICVK